MIGLLKRKIGRKLPGSLPVHPNALRRTSSGQETFKELNKSAKSVRLAQERSAYGGGGWTIRVRLKHFNFVNDGSTVTCTHDKISQEIFANN